MREWVLGGLVGSLIVLGVVTWQGWSSEQMPVEQAGASETVELLARQTAVLERIATILERWDAQWQEAAAEVERRKAQLQQDRRPQSEVQGLQEFPKRLEKR